LFHFLNKINYLNNHIYELLIIFLLKISLALNDWGLGIGDWGLGIGDWAQSPIPNPQSPIPNPHEFGIFKITINIYLKNKFIYKTK